MKTPLKIEIQNIFDKELHPHVLRNSSKIIPSILKNAEDYDNLPNDTDEKILQQKRTTIMSDVKKLLDLNKTIKKSL